MEIKNSFKWFFVLTVYCGLIQLQTVTSFSICIKVCPAGEVCVMVEGRCLVPPCDQIPTCSRSSSKLTNPGVCRKPTATANCNLECTSDHDCFVGDKCCSNGCGMSCSRPLLPPKEGTCPEFDSSSIANCMTMCETDYDCTGSRKCCANGCGSMCTEPTLIKSKPGICPALMFIDRCTTECLSDVECANVEKCCSTSCGSSCQKPIGIITRVNMEKKCPKERLVVSDCWNRCISDADCFYDAICCKTACGSVCLTSAKESSFYPQSEQHAIVLTTIS